MTKIRNSAQGRRRFLQAGAGAGAALLTSGLWARPARANTGMIALVHTQAAGDSGPVDRMIAATKRLAEEHGLPFRTVYAQDPATYETIFKTLGNAGASVVVSTFNEVTEPFKAVAPDYPDTKWVQLFGDPMEPPIPNVVTVSYDYYLGCYLSGIFGARLSRSGKVGFIGGVSIPPINADFNAFKTGALSVNPDINVSVAFAGSFQDPAAGQEIATQMFGDGIDFIQTDAAATDFGIIAAANESEGRLVSVLDSAQYELGPQSVISIVSLDFGTSLYNEATRALGPDWAGGTHVTTGLGTGVIAFERSPLFEAQGDSELNARAAQAWEEIQGVQKAILDGTLEVPFNTTL